MNKEIENTGGNIPINMRVNQAMIKMTKQPQGCVTQWAIPRLLAS